MGNPIPVVAAIITVVELVQLGDAAVDGEEGRRNTAGVCGRCVRSVAPDAGTRPAEEIFRPWVRRSSSTIEGGTQTEDFIDLMLDHCRQVADGVGQCHVYTNAASPGKRRAGTPRKV